MRAIEKWAEDKAPIIALFAPQFAAFARELPEIYRSMKTRQLATRTGTLPHLPSWYALYKDHSRYCDPFINMLLEASTLARCVVNFGADLNELSRKKEELVDLRLTQDDIVEGQRFWKHLLSLSFDEMRSDFENLPLEQDISIAVERCVTHNYMELCFVFLVYTPCLILYKMSPARLYHKARLGDVSAIDKLLRLDPLMLHDPAIGQQIQKIRLFGRKTTYQNLIEAPLKPIKAKLTNGKIKTSIAALISDFANRVGQPLTATEIRKLFDAVAQDADKRDIDTILPDSPESFYKSIQRKRRSWRLFLTPDSK